MSNQANQGSDPGSQTKEKNDKPGHNQFQEKKAQSQHEPEQFRFGRNDCDHNEEFNIVSEMLLYVE